MPDNEHLDKNIRKLLAKTSPDLQLPAEARQKTLSALYEMAARRAPQPPQRKRRSTMTLTGFIRYGIAACIGAALAILVLHLRSTSNPQPTDHQPSAVSSSSQPTDHSSSAPSSAAPAPAARPAEEAETPTANVESLFKAGDTAGLIAQLSNGPLEARLIAANYLAAMGDANAIPAMEAASRKFSGPEWTNPYKKPIQTLTYLKERSSGTNPTNRRGNMYMERPGEIPRLVNIQVADGASGAPVADVNVTMITQEYPNPRQLGRGTTGPDGKCRLVVADSRGWNFNLTTWCKGYVPVRVYASFNSPTGSITKEIAIPKAMTVGGIVKTTDGQPLEGVKVQLSPSFSSRRNMQIETRPAAVVTDKDGLWSSDSAVPEDVSRIDIQCAHPAYVQVDEPSNWMQDIELFQKGQWPTTMVKGVSLSGIVLDPTGRPMPAAKVQVTSYYLAGQSLAATSSQSGAFTIPLCRPGKTTLKAEAAPFIENSVTITADADKSDIQIPLLAPQVLLGRVVDPEGDPIVDANVWPTGNHWGGRRGEWKTTTDGLGRFRWDGAPPREIVMHFSKTGFMSAWRKLTPTDQEQTITLSRTITVSGKVIDLATGRPIEKFSAAVFAHITNSGSDSASYRQFTNGQYTLSIPYEGDRYTIRVSASGYTMADNGDLPAAQDGRITRDVSLTRVAEPNYASFAGVVYCPDGSPAVGAQILPVSAGHMAHLRNGKIVRGFGGMDDQIVKTAEDGSFKLAKVQVPTSIVAIHDLGYGEIADSNLTAAGRVDLTPWGGVEGVFYLNGRPLANKTLQLNQSFSGVRVSMQDAPRMLWSMQYSLTTDAKGVFKCDRMFAGKYAAMAENAADYTGTNKNRVFEVEAGKTTRVELGEKDARLVTATLQMPEGLAQPINWQHCRATLGGADNFDCVVASDAAASEVKYPWPAGADSMPLDELLKWCQQSSLPELAAYKKAFSQRQKELLAGRKSVTRMAYVDETGVVSITDAVAGRYSLKISIYAGTDLDDGNPRFAGIGSCDLTIPTLPKDASKTTDLGTLKLDMLFFSPGHPMPPLKMTALDGKDTDLSAFRGKFVLLNLWPSMFFNFGNEGIGANIAAARQFSSDPRIKVVNVSNHIRQPEPTLFAKFLIQNGLADGYLVPTSRENSRTIEVMQGVGQVGGTCSVIVDPDGKVVAAWPAYNAKQPTIEAAVAAALAAK